MTVVSMVTWDLHLREVLGGRGIAVKHPGVSFNPVRTKSNRYSNVNNTPRLANMAKEGWVAHTGGPSAFVRRRRKIKAQAEGISCPTNPELPAVWTYPKPSHEASHELHLPWPLAVKSQELENSRDLPSQHLSK